MAINLTALTTMKWGHLGTLKDEAKPLFLSQSYFFFYSTCARKCLESTTWSMYKTRRIGNKTTVWVFFHSPRNDYIAACPAADCEYPSASSALSVPNHFVLTKLVFLTFQNPKLPNPLIPKWFIVEMCTPLFFHALQIPKFLLCSVLNF